MRPADSIPGTARTRCNTSLKKSIAAGGVGNLVRVMETSMVSTLEESKPGLTLRSSNNVRTMSPAPTSRTSESATSETTRRLRVLPPESELPRLWPSFRPSFTSTREKLREGWQAIGEKTQRNIEGHASKQEAEHASDHGQQYSFRKNVAKNRWAAGSQRAADRNFFAARESFGEDEIGNVGASDEKIGR